MEIINIGNKITYLRNNRGYTQDSLAKLSGISTSNISNLENGENKIPLLKTVYGISKALNIPLDYFFSSDKEFLYFTTESLLKKSKLISLYKVSSFIKDYVLKNFNSSVETYENKLTESDGNILNGTDESIIGDMQIDKILGKKIKYYRNLMHITQEQFSELINITPHYCYEIERHLKLPSLSLFLDICKVLKTPASCLLLETDKAFYYSNREMYDKIRTLDESSLKKIIAALDAINNN